MVLTDRGIGMQIFPFWTPKAIVVLFVNEAAVQVFAVSDAATPKRNEGLFALLGQRADDGRRTVATVRDCFANRQLVSIFNPL